MVIDWLHINLALSLKPVRRITCETVALIFSIVEVRHGLCPVEVLSLLISNGAVTQHIVVKALNDWVSMLGIRIGH